MLKVRDWTTRKSRDFNEEYPKLRFLFDPDFCDPPVLCVSVLHWNNLYVLRLSHLIRVVCLPLFPGVSLAVLPSPPPSQDIFPPKCPAYVGSMSVSSCPPPHHHHTLDAIWLPLQRPAWRHQWVLWLRGQWFVSSAAELKVCLSGLTFASRPPVRLCRGPDAGSEVCPGHCLWNGLFTHAWTNDPSSLSQQQECDGENQNGS